MTAFQRPAITLSVRFAGNSGSRFIGSTIDSYLLVSNERIGV
jgi:hypothetical protein